MEESEKKHTNRAPEIHGNDGQIKFHDPYTIEEIDVSKVDFDTKCYSPIKGVFTILPDEVMKQVIQKRDFLLLTV